jgi:hypothetical protein
MMKWNGIWCVTPKTTAWIPAKVRKELPPATNNRRRAVRDALLDEIAKVHPLNQEKQERGVRHDDEEDEPGTCQIRNQVESCPDCRAQPM